jgi:hypothetical protein
MRATFVKVGLCFDQWFEHKLLAKMLSFSALVNSTQPQLTKFFTIFHFKLKCHPKAKLWPSKDWTTFMLGEFEVFR